jgi:hypothetical protein
MDRTPLECCPNIEAGRKAANSWPGRAYWRRVSPSYALDRVTTKYCRNAANETDAAGMSLEVLLKGSAEGSVEQYILSIATKKPIKSSEAKNHQIVIILPSSPSEGVKAIVSELKAVAGANGSPVYSVTWPTAIPSLEAPPVIISLLEFNDSFITDLSEADYGALKALVLRGKRLLWVAKGSDPIMQTATGFLRSLSNENGGLDYCFVILEESNKRDALDVAKVIEQLLSTKEIETEYIDRNGEIYCSRWAEKRELSVLVGADGDGSHIASITLSEAQGGLTLTKQQSKPVSKAVFAASELADQPLADNEVEIDIRALLLR